LIDVIRENDPNHLIFFDFANENRAWHPHWPGRRGADIKCDLITFGQGYYDPRFAFWENRGIQQRNLGAPHSFMQTMEYCRTVSYNAPMVLKANRGFPQAFGSGEFGYEYHYAPRHDLVGTPGNKQGLVAPEEDEQKQYEWIAGLISDYVGGGAAYMRLYSYGVCRQPDVVGGALYDHKILHFIKQLSTSIRRRRAEFRAHDAKVLILRNKASYFSNLLDFDRDNIYNLGNMLYQLHVPFDTLSEEDLCDNDRESFKVNIHKYKFIFIPHQHQLFTENTWRLIRSWIEAETGRGLCVGYHGPFDRYFNDVDIPPDMRQVIGNAEYATSRFMSDDHLLTITDRWSSYKGPRMLPVNFTSATTIPPAEQNVLRIGSYRTPLAEDVAPIGRLGEKTVIVGRTCTNGNRVYSCGFPLGFANCYVHNELRTPCEFKVVYETMLKEVGIRGRVDAPSHLGVYVSEGGSLVLVRKRGDWDSGVITLPHAQGAFYTQATNLVGGEEVHLRLDLPAGEEIAILERIGFVRGDNAVEVRSGMVEGEHIDKVEFNITGNARCAIGVSLWPHSSYRLHLDGNMKEIATDRAGRVDIELDLSGKHTFTFEKLPSRNVGRTP
jgi:hypothetical protein